jgi:hypothetical protein
MVEFRYWIPHFSYGMHFLPVKLRCPPALPFLFGVQSLILSCAVSWLWRHPVGHTLRVFGTKLTFRAHRKREFVSTIVISAIELIVHWVVACRQNSLI